ncbi:hypothetical protein QQ045_021785 [Rhodiola kirilowii]
MWLIWNLCGSIGTNSKPIRRTHQMPDSILIVWLIFRPTPLNFHVTDASLTEFTITNNTLKYNLAVSLTARNPNSCVRMHYEKIEANSYYEDQRFSSVTLNDFDQGHKNTRAEGCCVVFGELESSEYDDEEKLTGVYPIDLRVYLRLKLRFGKLTTKTMKSKIACDLEVPLNNSNGFQTTKCKLKMSQKGGASGDLSLRLPSVRCLYACR